MWGCSYTIPTPTSFDALLCDKSRVSSARIVAPCGETFHRLDWDTGSYTIHCQAAEGLSDQAFVAPILSHYHIEERWVVACDGDRASLRRVIQLPAERTAADSRIERVSNNRLLVTCGSGEDRIVFVVHDAAANTIV